MGRGRKAARALRGEQGGFTLIELLIAATVGLVVVGGAVTMLVGAIHSEPRAAAKVTAIQQARTTVDRIVRELRQGREVASSPTPSSTQLGVVTYVKATGCTGAPTSTATLCKVTYACSGSNCTRTVAQADGSSPGSAVRVATGVSSPNVFTYSPSASSPAYVGVNLSLSADGEPVVLGDGAALRNPVEGE